MTEEIRLPIEYNAIEVLLHMEGAGLAGSRWTRRDPDALAVLSDEYTAAEMEAAVADFVPALLRDESYVPSVPTEVRQAVAFLRQRADAGDNIARAVLVCLRYVNSRLE